MQVYEHEYDLVLQPDINTKSHTQWFYFAIMNMRRNTRCRACCCHCWPAHEAATRRPMISNSS